MIYVLLPAYNEEKGLQEVLPVLERLREKLDAPLRVVVVNDGSRDRTAEVARSFQNRLDLHLIDFPKNQGVGEVFRQGFRFVVSDSHTPNDDICIVLDSDNTQDPALIPIMIEKIRGGSDLVIASRFEAGGKMIGCPWPRQLLSYGVGTLLKVFVGLRGVKDYSTFYRAHRVRILAEGFARYGDGLLAGKGFAVMGGMLIRLSNITDRMTEVPLVLRYDLKGGSSGIKLWKTIRGYIELIAESVRTRRFSRTP
ncbi:MAG: glycosyltransferase family 2 protein [Kiritimatiellae bacterium]|nr:glycosyltransferase family 2 protein [Kiritimatiellia bacterium]MCO6400933.1 glycosyltransferase family 2 protein [Verrucomicrobiota bacterium]